MSRAPLFEIIEESYIRLFQSRLADNSFWPTSSSLHLSIDPVAFACFATWANPLSLAMSEALVEHSPVDSLATNIPAPAVVNIIFELTLVDKVMTLSSDTLHSAILVNLTKGTLCVILTDSQVVVNRTMIWCIPHNVFSIENSKLSPLFNAIPERLTIVQCRNQSRVILWLRLEFIYQFLRQFWLAWYRWLESRWGWLLEGWLIIAVQIIILHLWSKCRRHIGSVRCICWFRFLRGTSSVLPWICIWSRPPGTISWIPVWRDLRLWRCHWCSSRSSRVSLTMLVGSCHLSHGSALRWSIIWEAICLLFFWKRAFSFKTLLTVLRRYVASHEIRISLLYSWLCWFLSLSLLEIKISSLFLVSAIWRGWLADIDSLLDIPRRNVVLIAIGHDLGWCVSHFLRGDLHLH